MSYTFQPFPDSEFTYAQHTKHAKVDDFLYPTCLHCCRVWLQLLNYHYNMRTIMEQVRIRVRTRT